MGTDLILPAIALISMLALIIALWHFYLKWAKTKKFLARTLEIVYWPWWGWVLFVFTGVPLAVWILIHAGGIVVWIFGGGPFRKIPLQPGEVEVIEKDDPIEPSYRIDHTPQLESPEMREARERRAAAAREWQSSIEQRAKAEVGNKNERGSFTVAIQLQPGDLKIIRFGIGELRKEHSRFNQVQLHGYVDDNVVYIQDQRNRVVATYNIIAQRVELR